MYAPPLAVFEDFKGSEKKNSSRNEDSAVLCTKTFPLTTNTTWENIGIIFWEDIFPCHTTVNGRFGFSLCIKCWNQCYFSRLENNKENLLFMSESFLVKLKHSSRNNRDQPFDSSFFSFNQKQTGKTRPEFASLSCGASQMPAKHLNLYLPIDLVVGLATWRRVAQVLFAWNVEVRERKLK